MHELIKNFIDGEWVGAAKTIKNINPATGESIGDVVASGKAEAEQAQGRGHPRGRRRNGRVSRSPEARSPCSFSRRRERPGLLISIRPLGDNKDCYSRALG